MNRDHINFLFLNLGHFYDHLFMLIFATAAALTLADTWNMEYAELIPYATPGFIAFGVGAIPAGWIADKWSREGMMTIFFIGIGLSSILTALAHTPIQIAVGLFFVGICAAIYHPVGIAMVVHGREKTGVPLAINGIFGNMGVAGAALITGFLVDHGGWRFAFVLPGIIAIATGFFYMFFVYSARSVGAEGLHSISAVKNRSAATLALDRSMLLRIFAIVLLSTGIGGLVFQSTTFSLPKIFAERLTGMADTATLVGWYAFVVFTIAALAQLVVGFLVDRYSLRTVFAFVAGLQVLFLGAMESLTGPMALLVAIGFMLVVFGQIPINDVLIARITKSEWRSRAYALRYIVTFTVMASAVPFIAWVHAGWGFSRLFFILALAAAVTFVAVLMLPRFGAAIRNEVTSTK